MMTSRFIFVLTFLLALSTTVAAEDVWPADSTAPCNQSTKQKAMYGKMTFQPSPSEKPFRSMEVVVRWDDLRFNPVSNPNNGGGVYVAYTFKAKNGPGGYLGPQITGKGGKKSKVLFSIWDADRSHTVDGIKVAKPSSSLAWPLNMNKCKRNCQDCGLSKLRDTKAAGISTGTQCKLPYPDMKVGDEYRITLKRTMKQKTINTSDYGGFPKGHLTDEFGEPDRQVTGAVWKVWMVDVNSGVKYSVGSILFEGDGSGMQRLGTFDEMLGCNKCNRIYHKDTRHSLVLDKHTNSPRRPIKMEGSTNYDGSTCKMYEITGQKDDHSITFEGGPFTDNPFTEKAKKKLIWEE